MAKKLLVADVPQVEARLAVVLALERPVFVHTLVAALKALAADDYDLVLIGVHFDDSRMFDLLREVRAGSRNRAVPIVCYRLRPLGFAALSTQVIEVTVKALGALSFTDLASHVTEEHGNVALVQLVAAATGSG
jgi:DNA-binding NtrC family response regulator